MIAICLHTIFWGSTLILLYTYAGYPLILRLLTRKKRYVPREAQDSALLPSISFLVCACNEEPVIERKLKNCLELDYPPDKLSFIFVADGSKDRTDEILRRYESARIRVLIRPERMGKINALKAGFRFCDSDLIVFSDANTFYRPNALRLLVRHFSDPQVGSVTGDVRLLPSAETFGVGEGFYYRYERSLQVLETNYWSMVSVDGAMYTIRRELLKPPAYEEVPDDFVIGMNIACQGFRIVYDPSAIGEEPPTPTGRQEFQRKVRIVAHGIQSVRAGEGVPAVGQWRVFWVYFSHKVLRWTAPVFLSGALLASAALAALSPAGRWLLAPQLVLYGLAVAGWKMPALDSRLFRVPYYFAMVNTAALFGLWRGLRRAEKVIGVKTDRVAVQ